VVEPPSKVDVVEAEEIQKEVDLIGRPAKDESTANHQRRHQCIAPGFVNNRVRIGWSRTNLNTTTSLENTRIMLGICLFQSSYCDCIHWRNFKFCSALQDTSYALAPAAYFVKLGLLLVLLRFWHFRWHFFYYAFCHHFKKKSLMYVCIY